MQEADDDNDDNYPIKQGKRSDGRRGMEKAIKKVNDTCET
jgi:hypothetical protein